MKTMGKFKSKRTLVAIVMALVLNLIVSSVAMAAPGFIVGGYRYLASEIAGNNALLLELNNAIGDGSGLIIDLGNGKPFNYGAWINAGGISYTGGYSSFAAANIVSIPAGTMIKHADGSTAADPAAETVAMDDFYVVSID